MMVILYASLFVSIITFIMYALDRRSKEQDIDWMTALKLSVFGGLISGGVAYSTTSGDSVIEIAKDIVSEIPVAQEMFIGEPTF